MGDDFIHAWTGRYQTGKGHLGRQQNPAPEGLRLFRIPDEHQRVTQALLKVEQERLAYLGLPLPAGLREIPLRYDQAWVLPAGLVLILAAGHVAQAKAHEAAVQGHILRPDSKVRLLLRGHAHARPVSSQDENLVEQQMRRPVLRIALKDLVQDALCLL